MNHDIKIKKLKEQFDLAFDSFFDNERTGECDQYVDLIPELISIDNGSTSKVLKNPQLSRMREHISRCLYCEHQYMILEDQIINEINLSINDDEEDVLEKDNIINSDSDFLPFPVPIAVIYVANGLLSESPQKVIKVKSDKIKMLRSGKSEYLKIDFTFKESTNSQAVLLFETEYFGSNSNRFIIYPSSFWDGPGAADISRVKESVNLTFTEDAKDKKGLIRLIFFYITPSKFSDCKDDLLKIDLKTLKVQLLIKEWNIK